MRAAPCLARFTCLLPSGGRRCWSKAQPSMINARCSFGGSIDRPSSLVAAQVVIAREQTNEKGELGCDDRVHGIECRAGHRWAIAASPRRGARARRRSNSQFTFHRTRPHPYPENQQGGSKAGQGCPYHLKNHKEKTGEQGRLRRAREAACHPASSRPRAVVRPAKWW